MRKSTPVPQPSPLTLAFIHFITSAATKLHFLVACGLASAVWIPSLSFSPGFSPVLAWIHHRNRFNGLPAGGKNRKSVENR